MRRQWDKKREGQGGVGHGDEMELSIPGKSDLGSSSCSTDVRRACPDAQGVLSNQVGQQRKFKRINSANTGNNFGKQNR